jgi:hypothetical protein
MTQAHTLTTREAAAAARRIIARTRGHVDVHGWAAEQTLRGIGTGFHIPATAYADGDDIRTQNALAAWLRRNAVDTAADELGGVL